KRKETNVSTQWRETVKTIFSRHGIPETVISDNGPCYNCKGWQNFAREYGFKHVTSSPQHPQANGKAEKGVHMIKQLLKKATDSQSDPYLALLSYRTAPLDCVLSPEELPMSRKLHTTLPCYAESKQSEVITKKQENLKWKQKQQYDKGTKALGLLEKDDVVRIQDQNAWSRKAIVLLEAGPRSYDVRTEEGHVFRRNRHNLLKTKETFQEEQCGEEDENVDVSHAEKVSDLKPSNGCENVEKNEVVSEPVLRRSERKVKRPVRLNL
uniref:Integrase catalytic domain-containing protein n=1 Tax=Maylandia zebra TaxID=106582 RepID=A0A3P9DN86_9CICH